MKANAITPGNNVNWH